MKHWIRLLCLPLLAMVAGMASAQDVIEISTVDQLKEFRDAVNGGNQYAGKTVKLTADLDLSSESNWKPIGNLVAYPGQSFNGIFDGDNHVISNLTVNDNTPNHAVAGLFGSVVNGTIKNLTVKNVNIQSTHYAGAIVAYSSNAPTIENCKVIGGTIKSTPEIVGSGYDNGDKVGGIMGLIQTGTINNCWVEGVTITGYRDLGGIAGYSSGSVTNNTVKNVTVQQDLTNGYKETTPTTIDDILGRNEGATLSNNIVIKSDYVAQIGETQYETLAAAVAAANTGDVIEVIKAGDYTLPNLSKNVTVEGAVNGVVFTHTTAGSVASIPNGASFKNVKFVFGNVDYHGFQHAGTINMENCTLDGKFFSYGDMNFTNCEFTQSASDYHMWCYSGNVTYTGCTFTANKTGKFLNIYNEGLSTKYTVTVENCKFVNNVAANKAALNVKATSGAKLLQFDVIINNCTTEGNFPAASSSQALVVLNDVVQVDDRTADGVDNIKVWQDGVLIYPVNYVAQIGETKYETLAAAVAAANAGDVIKVIKAGDYTLPSLSKNVTVEGAVDGVVFTHTTAGSVASIPNGASFKNVKFIFGNVNYHGFQHAGTINMEGCTLDGMFFSYGDMNFTNCEFTQSASDYHMWCYSGNVTYAGCTFTANKTGKFLNIYNEDGTTKYTVTVENCKFVNNVAANKAALNVKATCGAKLLQYDVIINNCTTEGSFPEASTSQALVVLNNVVQVDDRTADGVDNIKVWQDDVLIYPVNYVAQIGDVKYMTLQAALDAAEAANTENFVIDLLADAELDITAWDGTKNPLSIGTENTQSITINGNNHKLTFNQKNSDWNNVATMNDAQTKLVLNDMTISSAGHNNGPWNRHDINFNCAVELNNVTSDKALAFKNDATLKNVTITDNSGDIYAVWISPRGQKVDIDGLTINCGRGIKIDDEYSKTPYDATLNIANATFNTTKKSAILVKNGGETTINAGEGINIEHAAADTVNPVWVDEDKAEEFYKVTVTGANVVPESKESDYVACLMKGEQRWGYYKGTDALSTTIGLVKEGWSIKLHQTTTEAVEVSKPLVITKNGFTADNVTAGEGFVREENDNEIIIREASYVAQIGDVKYETLQAALDAAEEADTENFVIELLADAELDITAWDGTKNPLSIGTVNTQSITINGNNHKLTFNQKDSDWNNVATMNDAQTKLVLNDMTISNAGYDNSTWNSHDINFNCAVELNNVTSDKALAFKNDATLKNVTISDDSGDIYAVWISPRGQKININGLTINCGRGIKIDDQYVDTPTNATLNIANATFNTTKKSAILVKNNGETTINAGEGINIENAAADTVNPVWVDEDKAEEFYKVTVTGANVVPESKESDYVACLMKGEQRWGYYKGTDALSKSIAKVEEGWSIKLHNTTTEAVEVSKPLVITKNGFTADKVTAGEGFVREENDNEIIIREASYVAQIGDVKYETLQAALDAAEAADTKDFVIDLLADAELDITAWDGTKNPLSIGTVNTQSITINGNDHKLTFNHKNSDWNNVATMNDAQTKLVLNNMTISNAGHNNSTWNRHDINFNCAVELNNVTSDKALAFKNDATLKDVTITDNSGDIYAVWISPRGQKVDIDGLTINCSRGIKIDDEYVETPTTATLIIANATFNTTKKSAILVKNGGETTINAGEGINIENAAADKVNPVWVDEDMAEEFYKVTVTGANVVPESKESDYVACLMKGEQRWGYYKGSDALSRTIAQVEEGWSIKLHQTTTEAVEVSKPLVITKNGFTADNVTAGEGFVREETADEIIIKKKAEEVLVELIDGKPYPYPEGKECTSVTYKRTFKDSQVDKHQSWFVPFDYTITAEDMENFTFYSINMIASAADAGEVEDETKVYIYIKALDEGYTLKANRPYVVKPKSALTDHIFKAENITKVYAEDYTSRLFMATTPYNYNFYGNYRAKTFETHNQVMYMGGGMIGWNRDNATLGSYRWYIQLTPNGANDDYANIALTVVEEDGETNQIFNILEDNSEIEGIFTIGGIKVEKLVKGVNLIRYKNGQTKKVYIK